MKAKENAHLVVEEQPATNDKRRFEPDGERKPLAQDKPKINIKLRPRHKWVLIREIAQSELITDAGVVIPGADFFLNQHSPKHTYATVVEVSEGITDLEPGQAVIVTKFSLTLEALEMFTGDPSLKLVRDEEVYCAIEKVPCP